MASLFFVALLAAWQGMVWSGRWSPVLLPSPEAVGEYLWLALWDGTLLEAIEVTMRRLLVGYLIGIALGLPLGLLSSRFKFFEDTFGVLALGCRPCQACAGCRWRCCGSVKARRDAFRRRHGDNLVGRDRDRYWRAHDPSGVARAARTMGSEGFHQWTRVILPASLPYLISGMKQGWAFAWRSLMAAEIFVTILTGFGLGQLLHYGRELNAMEQVIGIMIVIVAIGLLADKVLFAPWERFLHRRWGTGGAVAT